MDNQSLEYIRNSEIVLIGIGEDFDNREDADIVGAFCLNFCQHR